MKKILLLFVAVWMTLAASAQVVTTSPDPVTEDSQNVEIYFHADRGSMGLKGSKSTDAIYAHTGVNVLNKTGGTTAWKYAPTWGTNTAKYKLEYVSTDLWKLKLGNVRTFYGVAADEIVTHLCFVFRNADGTKEGKGPGDILVELPGWSFPSSPSALTTVPKYGANRNADGSVTFCICAPNKKNASLIGSWNNYVYTKDQTMEYIDKDVFGQKFRYFTITLPESTLKRGVDFSYYYMIDGTSVGDPYARLVLDCYNDQYLPANVFADRPKYPIERVQNTMLAHYSDTMFNYDWKVKDFKIPAKDHLVIYEMLFRDFTGTEGAAKGDGTVRQAIEKIPYLKSLGVNAVELMPIMEFNGNLSWGYNTNFYFAPDKAYGSPKDYKEFIDLCHQNGIAVILDIVFNQSDGLHPWYQLYPVGSNPFYNATAPHDWSVLNDWRQDNPMVEQQWQDAVKFWLSEYNVDGFRFDLVKGLGDNNSYGAGTNNYNQSRVDRMKRIHGYMKEVKPDALHINELLGDAAEDNKLAEDGQLNWLQCNHAGAQYVMGWQSESGLHGMYAPEYGRTAGSTVAFLESHDEERIAYSQLQYGHADVKGKLDPSFARLGSAAAQMILAPGSHMIWQFQEQGNNQTTKNGGGNNTDSKKVQWNKLTNAKYQGLVDNYGELINIRLNNKDLFSDGATMNMYVKEGDWYGGRTMTFKRGNKELFVAINPNTSGSTINCTVSFNSGNNDDYQIISKTYNTTPSFNAGSKTITVAPNSYVVVSSNNVSAVEDLGSDVTEFLAWSRGGELFLAGLEAPAQVYSLNGVKVFETSDAEASVQLPSGIYLVRCGNTVKKIAL